MPDWTLVVASFVLGLFTGAWLMQAFRDWLERERKVLKAWPK